MSLKRLDNALGQSWHEAINQHSQGLAGTDDWPSFMHEAKTARDEIPRMELLFGKERKGELPKVSSGCSCGHEGKPIENNYLQCCLGKKTKECSHLLALENSDLQPEQIDHAKAWTCAAHILSSGGDVMGEGYLLTVGDRIFWDGVYQSLGGATV